MAPQILPQTLTPPKTSLGRGPYDRHISHYSVNDGFLVIKCISQFEFELKNYYTIKKVTIVF